MNLEIRTRLWTWNPWNLGFDGVDIGPLGKRKLVARNDFARRYVVRAGSYYRSDGGYGSGRFYHGPVVYFVDDRVCLARCEYGRGDISTINRLVQSFIDFGPEGLRCE